MLFCGNPYVRGILREEHFLREIDFTLISRESFPNFQNQLSRQFAEFRKKVGKLSKTTKFTDLSFQITLYILSTAAMLGGLPLGAAAGIIAGLKVPWLVDIVAKTFEKSHRDKLASYVMEPRNQK